jgi:hypothetical protein
VEPLAAPAVPGNPAVLAALAVRVAPESPAVLVALGVLAVPGSPAERAVPVALENRVVLAGVLSRRRNQPEPIVLAVVNLQRVEEAEMPSVEEADRPPKRPVVAVAPAWEVAAMAVAAVVAAVVAVAEAVGVAEEAAEVDAVDKNA